MKVLLITIMAKQIPVIYIYTAFYVNTETSNASQNMHVKERGQEINTHRGNFKSCKGFLFWLFPQNISCNWVRLNTMQITRYAMRSNHTWSSYWQLLPIFLNAFRQILKKGFALWSLHIAKFKNSPPYSFVGEEKRSMKYASRPCYLTERERESSVLSLNQPYFLLIVGK